MTTADVQKICVQEHACVHGSIQNQPKQVCRVCVCACYLRGFVGSPAVLVAMEAGQEHVLISVHLTKAQCLMRIITNNIVAVEQLLSLCVSILAEKKREMSG